MNELDRQDLFAELVARYHVKIYAYIFAIVRNRDDANDLFQSVCLILWRKFDSFEPATNFFSWARQTAKFVIRGFFRHRNKLPNYVNEQLLDALTETDFEPSSDDTEFYLIALRRCREKLDTADGELLELRYVAALNSRQIADRLQRPQTSICRSLNRIRSKLLECIEKELDQRKPSEKPVS